MPEPTIAEMERRVKDWLGVHSVNTRNVPPYGSDLNLWDYKMHSAIWSITDKSGYAWGPGEFSRRLRAILQNRASAMLPLDDTDLVFASAADRLRALCAVLDQIEGKP